MTIMPNRTGPSQQEIDEATETFRKAETIEGERQWSVVGCEHIDDMSPTYDYGRARDFERLWGGRIVQRTRYVIVSQWEDAR